jgi:hypothetical protein
MNRASKYQCLQNRVILPLRMRTRGYVPESTLNPWQGPSAHGLGEMKSRFRLHDYGEYGGTLALSRLPWQKSRLLLVHGMRVRNRDERNASMFQNQDWYSYVRVTFAFLHLGAGPRPLHPVSGALVRRGGLSLCQSAQSST